MAMHVKKMVYLDNNSTTEVCGPAMKAIMDWTDTLNISSSSRFAKPAQQLVEKIRHRVLDHCGVSSATHTVIFNSGATEGNSYILTACVLAYRKKLIEKRSGHILPHIVTSSIEHHSIIECCHHLVTYGLAEVTFVDPTVYGNVLAQSVEAAIRPNTCLISVMYANNEIPTVNSVAAIGKIAHQHSIPMHSDCVQMFGKREIDIKAMNLDAITATAHKFYGPKQCGILIMNNKLITGYGLTAEIHGTQQFGLRGGTECVATYAALSAALDYTFRQRKEKNEKLASLRETCIKMLHEQFPIGDYVKYTKQELDDSVPLELVFLGPPPNRPEHTLFNTILLSVVKNKGKPICNTELKHYLDDHGVVVSIASACLTSQQTASHVLSAINAPDVVKRGVIRVSFGDHNTKRDVQTFVEVFVEGVKKQCYDIRKYFDRPTSGANGTNAALPR